MDMNIDNTIVPLMITKYGEDITVEIGECMVATIIIPVYGEVRNGKVDIKFIVKNGPMDGVRRGDVLKINKFGLTKLGPSVWQVDPIVYATGFKAYVIITNVPEPAPWEVDILGKGNFKVDDGSFTKVQGYRSN